MGGEMTPLPDAAYLGDGGTIEGSFDRGPTAAPYDEGIRLHRDRHPAGRRGKDRDLKRTASHNSNPAQHPGAHNDVPDDNAPSLYDLFLEHQRQAWTDIQSSSDEKDHRILTL